MKEKKRRLDMDSQKQHVGHAKTGGRRKIRHGRGKDLKKEKGGGGLACRSLVPGGRFPRESVIRRGRSLPNPGAKCGEPERKGQGGKYRS